MISLRDHLPGAGLDDASSSDSVRSRVAARSTVWRKSARKFVSTDSNLARSPADRAAEKGSALALRDQGSAGPFDRAGAGHVRFLRARDACPALTPARP